MLQSCNAGAVLALCISTYDYVFVVVFVLRTRELNQFYGLEVIIGTSFMLCVSSFHVLL